MLDPNVLSPSLTKNLGFSTATVPSNLYYSAEQFELERERIFRRAWLKVGRIEQIPKSGDFFVKEIDLFSASIILSRARDGAIHALHNVCSHRGNQVVHEREGNRSKFTCRYHSWTFQNTGELVGVPDERSFFALDKKKCGLTPVAVDVWEGWIFINFQSKPEVSLKEFLGPFGEAFSGVAYPNPENSVVLKGEFQANWKTVADAFSEAYHLSSIHPKTFGPLYAGKSNPFSRPLSAEIYGPHRSMSTWLDTTFQMPDSAKVERWVSPPGETVTGTRKPGQRNALIDHPAINPSKSDAWASDAKWVFPNWHIQISANMFWTHEFWPVSATRTKWEGPLLRAHTEDGAGAHRARIFHRQDERRHARGFIQHRKHATRHDVRRQAVSDSARRRVADPSLPRTGGEVDHLRDGCRSARSESAP